MTIYNAIKTMRLQARKDRDATKAAALTYIQGELERGEKDVSDEKVLKTLRGVQANLLKSGESYETTLLGEILEAYTPKQLSEDAIRVAITLVNAAGDKPTLGEVQKFFKENYSGQYDGAVVTKLYKEL